MATTTQVRILAWSMFAKKSITSWGLGSRGISYCKIVLPKYAHWIAMGYLGLCGQTPFELQNQSINFDNATLHKFSLLLQLCDFVFYRSLMTVRSFWIQFRFVLSALDDTISRIGEIYASNQCALFSFISYPFDLGEFGRTTDSVNLYSQIRSMHKCCR